MKTNYSVLLLIPIFILGCKSSGNQGTVKQGKGGQIESAEIIARCTPPQKTYTKELEASVDAEMDSLKSISNPKLEASLNTTVVQLAQYTSQGLDRDLALFRICEMANNRGMSDKDTAKLIDDAMENFDEEVKKKNQR